MVLFTVVLGCGGLFAACAPSVSCPTGTRIKKVTLHSAEHTRISHYCLKEGSGREVRHGPYLFGHLVGGRTRLMKRGGYRGGLRHGRWVLRKGDDVVESHFKEDYRHGLHRRTVAGAVVESGRYVRTLREGAWVLVKSVGGGRVETEQVIFRGGKRHGAARYADAQGRLLRRGSWAKGVRHGRWTYFQPDGRTHHDEQYQRGVKHGLVRYYDPHFPLVRRTCRYIQGSRESCKDIVHPMPPRH